MLLRDWASKYWIKISIISSTLVEKASIEKPVSPSFRQNLDSPVTKCWEVFSRLFIFISLGINRFEFIRKFQTKVSLVQNVIRFRNHIFWFDHHEPDNPADTKVPSIMIFFPNSKSFSSLTTGFIFPSRFQELEFVQKFSIEEPFSDNFVRNLTFGGIQVVLLIFIRPEIHLRFVSVTSGFGFFIKNSTKRLQLEV